MEKAHILNILKETKKALKENDVIKLKDLSNQTIHSASIQQDDASIALAVIVYSLGKIIERTNYQKYSGFNNFIGQSITHIDKAISYLEKDNEKAFRKTIVDIEKLINKLTGNFKAHVQQVFQKARINKASRIYEHGISMEKTANLLGITVFELADYAGKTGISDIGLSLSIPIETRIKYISELFK